jgi:hypothetical protein
MTQRHASKAVSTALLGAVLVVVTAGCKSKSETWSGKLAVGDKQLSSIGCKPKGDNGLTLYTDENYSIDLEPWDDGKGWSGIVWPPSRNIFTFQKGGNGCSTFEVTLDDKVAISGAFKADCTHSGGLKADVTFTKCRE